MNNEYMVKAQIIFICDLNKIEHDGDFIDFVYNKHLKEYSGEIIKKLRKEYKEEK